MLNIIVQPTLQKLFINNLGFTTIPLYLFVMVGSLVVLRYLKRRLRKDIY
jgi:hypothetical protein